MSYITDNEGNKYELSYKPQLDGGAYILKPIAPVVEDRQEAYFIELSKFITSDAGTMRDTDIFSEKLQLTKAQAEAVAKALAALLEFVNTPVDTDSTDASDTFEISKIKVIAARQAVQGGDDE